MAAPGTAPGRIARVAVDGRADLQKIVLSIMIRVMGVSILAIRCKILPFVSRWLCL